MNDDTITEFSSVDATCEIPFIDLAPGDTKLNKQHQVCIVCAYNLQSEREHDVRSERERIQSKLVKEFGKEIIFRPLSQEGIIMINHRYYSHIIDILPCRNN